VTERLQLHILCTDHVMIQFELKYLIGGKVARLKYQVFGGKTNPFRMGQVSCVVSPMATVRFQMEPEAELTQQFRPHANAMDENENDIEDTDDYGKSEVQHA